MTTRFDRLKVVDLIDRSVETLDRRLFFKTSATSLALAWLSACNSYGPDSAKKLLAYATKKNEMVERWLTRHTAMDHGSPGAVVAGNRFPSYFVSPSVPVFDPAVSGPWTLEVSGLVATPLVLSLEQLIAMPRVEQRVNHYCVEGWNAVARFAGVPLRDIAAAAGVLPNATVVDFQSFDDGYHESWDMESAMHPQTIIVYAKDGDALSPAYGAPARVHAPVKLGYKNTKYLTKIVFMDAPNGGYWSDRGYEWYGGT